MITILCKHLRWFSAGLFGTSQYDASLFYHHNSVPRCTWYCLTLDVLSKLEPSCALDVFVITNHSIMYEKYKERCLYKVNNAAALVKINSTDGLVRKVAMHPTSNRWWPPTAPTVAEQTECRTTYHSAFVRELGISESIGQLIVLPFHEKKP